MPEVWVDGNAFECTGDVCFSQPSSLAGCTSPRAAGGRSAGQMPGTRSSPGAVRGRRVEMGAGAAGGWRLGAPDNVDG